MHDGEVTESAVDPADLGIARGTTEALRGGDAAHNADVVRRLLDGETGAGARRRTAQRGRRARRARHADRGRRRRRCAAGLAKAAEAVDSGAAKAALERWVAASAR